MCFSADVMAGFPIAFQIIPLIGLLIVVWFMPERYVFRPRSSGLQHEKQLLAVLPLTRVTL